MAIRFLSRRRGLESPEKINGLNYAEPGISSSFRSTLRGWGEVLECVSGVGDVRVSECECVGECLNVHENAANQQETQKQQTEREKTTPTPANR